MWNEEEEEWQRPLAPISHDYDIESHMRTLLERTETLLYCCEEIREALAIMQAKGESREARTLNSDKEG